MAATAPPLVQYRDEVVKLFERNRSTLRQTTTRESMAQGLQTGFHMLGLPQRQREPLPLIAKLGQLKQHLLIAFGRAHLEISARHLRHQRGAGRLFISESALQFGLGQPCQ